MKRFTRLAAASLAASALAAAAALPAQAQTARAAATSGTGTAGLKAAQTLTTSRIDGRLETLRALSMVVNNATHLSTADRSTLGSLINSDISGLTSLRSKVAAESTVAAVRADATAMVDDYRVYMLVVPKVHLTNVFDIESAAATALQKVHDKLATRVAAAPGGGTSAEKSQLADMQAQIQAAQQADANRVATLLGIQPSPNADAIHSALSPLAGDAKDARKALAQARDDAKKIRAALK
ncbi:MAG TPA: hypothetical protein VGS97_07010 [Actinocrinis sp.]|uniref:hypothetical protein n=1 Tax=Actinocrinis sp. TaxID=1920516 RepID=UPI002DDD5CC5|nr:hypothetical protein [Actinocrinis sp.]HEV2343823.1 hypothetical protein [Actinocrinis sp.]